jgi:hypothetical protein
MTGRRDLIATAESTVEQSPRVIRVIVHIALRISASPYFL